jgi:hypothetical protein
MTRVSGFFTTPSSNHTPAVVMFPPLVLARRTKLRKTSPPETPLTVHVKLPTRTSPFCASTGVVAVGALERAKK